MNPRVSVPKLLRRKDRWYVRVQVPKAMQAKLGKKEYWISLRTTDRLEALKIAPDVVRNKRTEINQEYNRHMATKRTMAEFNQEQHDALFRDAYAYEATPGLDLIPLFEASPFETFLEFAEHRERQLEETVARLRATRGQSTSIDVSMRLLASRNGIEVEAGSMAEADLRKICVESFIEAKRNIIAGLRGRSIHSNPNPIIVNLETGAPREFTPLSEILARPPSKPPSLTALLEKFLSNPNKLRTEKTMKSIRGYMGVVFQILGDNTPVNDIREQDCERVRDLIARLPPNFMKLPDADKHTLDELADLAERKKMAKLSPTGVNNYLRWLLTFLAWCHRKGMIDRMPTAYAEIKVADPVRKQDKREAFSNDQLNVIFRSRLYQDQERDSSLFWVPLIALWNGMRSNEICQLDVADIMLEENVWGFDVTHVSTTGGDDKRIKTGSSIRFVPMHPRLIDFGLLDFHVKRPRDAKLFGDITRGSDGYYSTNFSKKVNRYLKGIGVHGPKHKFHSFRHNFRDALRRGRVDREIGKALGGWTGGNTDAFDIYGNGFEVEELRDEIVRVDYPHVDWASIQG
mgnify:CR=1 FL=1